MHFEAISSTNPHQHSRLLGKRGDGHPAAGFTLIELMVALTVLAVLLSLAAPSFADLVSNNRVATETNELMGTLNLARMEAVRRAQGVTVHSADPNDYAKGWSVLPDANLDGAPASPATSSDGAILLVTGAFRGNTTITRVTRNSGNAPFTYSASTASDKMYVTFDSRGGISSTSSAFFRICDANHKSVKGRIVQVNLVGKVSLAGTNEMCS